MCRAKGWGGSAASERGIEDHNGLYGHVEGAGQIREGKARRGLGDEDGRGRLGQVPPSRYSNRNFRPRCEHSSSSISLSALHHTGPASHI